MNKEDIENFKGFQSPESEKETALFFCEIGLKCVDLCFKITGTDGSPITDIDGIFLDQENKVILIYDDSTQKNDSNAKISVFFNKCKEPRKLLPRRDLLKILRLFCIEMGVDPLRINMCQNFG